MNRHHIEERKRVKELARCQDVSQQSISSSASLSNARSSNAGPSRPSENQSYKKPAESDVNSYITRASKSIAQARAARNSLIRNIASGQQGLGISNEETVARSFFPLKLVLGPSDLNAFSGFRLSRESREYLTQFNLQLQAPGPSSSTGLQRELTNLRPTPTPTSADNEPLTAPDQSSYEFHSFSIGGVPIDPNCNPTEAARMPAIAGQVEGLPLMNVSERSLILPMASITAENSSTRAMANDPPANQQNPPTQSRMGANRHHGRDKRR